MPKAKTAIRDKIIDVTLQLAADHGWRGVSVAAICEKVKIEKNGFYREFDHPAAVIAAYSRKVSADILAASGDFSEEDSPRDRLFDVLMQRFDAAAPYKAGLKAVLEGVRFDPVLGLTLACTLPSAMKRTLQAAHIGTSGAPGILRSKGLAVIYLSALRVWVTDDSPDMAKTMPHLDKALGRAERLANVIERCSPLKTDHR